MYQFCRVELKVEQLTKKGINKIEVSKQGAKYMRPQLVFSNFLDTTIFDAKSSRRKINHSFPNINSLQLNYALYTWIFEIA